MFTWGHFSHDNESNLRRILYLHEHVVVMALHRLFSWQVVVGTMDVFVGAYPSIHLYVHTLFTL